MNVTRKLSLTGYGRREATVCMVECEINVEPLLKALGEKAFRNKTHKTRALAGLIAVTVRPTLAARGD